MFGLFQLATLANKINIACYGMLSMGSKSITQYLYFPAGTEGTQLVTYNYNQGNKTTITIKLDQIDQIKFLPTDVRKLKKNYCINTFELHS